MYCSVISWTVSMTMELPALLLHSTMYIAFSVCMWWHMAINKQMVPWVLKLMKLGGWWGLTNLVPSISPAAITLFLSVTSIIFHCCNNCNFFLRVLNLFLFPAILIHKAFCAFPRVLVGKRQHTAVPDGNLCLLTAQLFCSEQPACLGEQIIVTLMLQLPLWYGC